MSDLYVELDELEHLRRRVRNVAATLSECSGKVGGADATELGNPKLDDSCDDFYSSWSYGIGQLGKAAGVVAEKLGEAMRVYREADSHLAGSIKRPTTNREASCGGG